MSFYGSSSRFPFKHQETGWGGEVDKKLVCLMSELLSSRGTFELWPRRLW